MIVGRAESVRRIKRNPLFRTMRVDKIVFSMLERLFTIYLNGSYPSEIKLWELLSVPESVLYKRAKKMMADLGHPEGLSVEASRSFVGGGALPEAHIPSVAIVFSAERKVTALVRRFRELPVPVIGRVDEDRFMLDLKAVAEEELPILTDSIREVLD